MSGKIFSITSLCVASALGKCADQRFGQTFFEEFGQEMWNFVGEKDKPIPKLINVVRPQVHILMMNAS